ncbi:hypothetical protein [Streptomyces sp. WL006]|uniref:hypothetical protein n=1 Tax=Streptomyces sp. WL006 TaxID=3423915 RepID=UPI003F6BB308
MLADILVRGAERWEKSALLHPSYVGCRLDVTDGEQSSGFIEASVRWNTSTLSEVDKVKAGRRLT